MPKEDTQFKKGNHLGTGGRPKKPEWLKGKGEQALKVVYDILQDPQTKTADKLAAAKMIAEYDLGKPVQKQENTNVNLNAEPSVSLEESLRIIKELTADG